MATTDYRRAAFDAHGRECAECGVTDNLEVHHRDGDPLNNHLINLIGLCYRCHRMLHKRRSTARQLSEWKAKAESL